MSPSPSIILGPAELVVVQTFCPLERVWFCWNYGVIISHRNLVQSLVAVQSVLNQSGSMLSQLNVYQAITFIMQEWDLLSEQEADLWAGGFLPKAPVFPTPVCDAEIEKCQVDQWESPALYWLFFVRGFDVFWSSNKEDSALLIYISSSCNCPSIFYTQFPKYC